MSTYEVRLDGGDASPVRIPDGPIALSKAETSARALASAHRGAVAIIFRVAKNGKLSYFNSVSWNETRRQPERAHASPQARSRALARR